MLAALFWRRSTRHGAIAAVLSVAASWAFFVWRGWSSPDYTVGGTGIMPVAVMLALSATVLVVVSWLTRPPGTEVLDRFFPRRETLG